MIALLLSDYSPVGIHHICYNGRICLFSSSRACSRICGHGRLLWICNGSASCFASLRLHERYPPLLSTTLPGA